MASITLTSKIAAANPLVNEKLFYLQSLVKGKTQQGVILRLRVTDEIGKFLLSLPDFKPGSRKIKFVSESPHISTDPSNVDSDTIAFRFYKDEQTGRAVFVYRHKYFRASADKALKRTGGAEQIELKHARPCEVVEFIRSMQGDGISTWDLQDLAAVSSAFSSWENDCNMLMKESYGKSKEKLQTVQNLLGKIGAAATEAEDIKKTENASANDSGGQVVKAALFWPFGMEAAEKIAEFYTDGNPLLEEFLKEWSLKYVRELNLAIGTGRLELSLRDQMQNLKHLVERVEEEVPPHEQEAFAENLKTFNKESAQVIHIVDNLIDDKLSNLLRKVEPGAKELLVGICEIAQMRNDVLSRLVKLYALDQQLARSRQAQAIRQKIRDIAANIGKVTQTEVELLKEIQKDEKFAFACKTYLTYCKNNLQTYNNQFKISFPGFKGKKANLAKDPKEEERLKRLLNEAANIESRIKNFRELGANEYSSLLNLQKSSKDSVESVKKAVDSRDAGIAQCITDIGNAAPALGHLLREVNESLKEHPSYKRGEPVAKDPGYYLTPMGIAASLDAVATEKSHAEMVEAQAKGYSKLYALFEKFGLKQGVLAHLDQFLYSSQKGFDLEVDTSTKGRGTEMEVPYWEANSPDNKDRLLCFKIAGRQFSVRIPPPEEIEAQQDFIGKKSLKEIVIGGYTPLEVALPGITKDSPLAEIYLKAFELANLSNKQIDPETNKEMEVFEIVQRDIRNKSLKTSYLLLSLVDKDPLAGCRTNFAGNNLPAVLSPDETLLDSIQKNYPNPDMELENFFHYLEKKRAKRLLDEFNRTLPYWALEYAKRSVPPAKTV